MFTFNERMNNAKSLQAKQAIIDEAKQVTHQYAMQYPTKIQVTSLAEAEQAYRIKEATGTSDGKELYLRYVEALLGFADYITALEARKH